MIWFKEWIDGWMGWKEYDAKDGVVWRVVNRDAAADGNCDDDDSNDGDKDDCCRGGWW